MSNRTYEDYIKNDCHPVGYNEPCQSYYFAQSSVDLLLNKIDLLKQQLVEKDKEIERLNTIKNNAIECADLFKVALSVRQKNLAIQELNNLKEYCTKQFNLWENNYLDETYDNKDIAHAYYDIIFSIQERIKELKGE